MTQSVGQMITTLREEFIRDFKQVEAKIKDSKEAFNNAYLKPYQDRLALLVSTEEKEQVKERTQLVAILKSEESGSIYGVAGHLFDLAFFTSGIDVVSEEMRQPNLDYAQFDWLKGRLIDLQQDIIRFTRQLTVKYLTSCGVQFEGLADNASPSDIAFHYQTIIEAARTNPTHSQVLTSLTNLCETTCQKIQTKIDVCNRHTQTQPQQTITLDLTPAAPTQPLLQQAAGSNASDHKSSGTLSLNTNFNPFTWSLGWQDARHPNFFFYTSSSNYRNAVIAHDVVRLCAQVSFNICGETSRATHAVGNAAVNAAHVTAHAAGTAANAATHAIGSAAHAASGIATHAAHAVTADVKVAGNVLAHGATGAAHLASTAAHSFAHAAGGAAQGLGDAAHALGHVASAAGSALGHAGSAVGHALSSGGGIKCDGECIKACGGLCACCGGSGVVASGAATAPATSTANNTAQATHLFGNLLHAGHSVYLTTTLEKFAAAGVYGLAVGPRLVYTMGKPAVIIAKKVASCCFEVDTYKVGRASARLAAQLIVASAIGVPFYLWSIAGPHTAAASFGTGVIAGDTAAKLWIQRKARSKYNGISNPEKWILNSKVLKQLQDQGIPPQRAQEIISDIEYALANAKNQRSPTAKGLEFWWGFLPNCLKAEIEVTLGEALKLFQKGKVEEAIAKVNTDALRPIYNALTLRQTLLAPPRDQSANSVTASATAAANSDELGPKRFQA